MAVTSLWAVKGRIDHLINYVENPEKTRADTVGDKELQALWDIVGYTTRAEKTEQKLFVNGINGSANKRREMGLDDTGYCDAQMIAEWKMEAMGKLLLESLWTERKSAVQLACQMLRDCVCDEPVNQGSPKLGTQLQITRVESKIENLIEMRTEGEISKEEFLKQRTKLDGELKALQTEAQSEPEAAPQSKSAGLAWEVIEDTLNQLIDFSQPTLDKKLYDKFVSKIIPRGNNRFAWVMNLDNGLTEDFTLVAEGRKSKQTVSVDDSEGGESPLHNIGVIRLADFKKWRKSQKSSPVQFPHRRRLKGRTKQA